MRKQDGFTLIELLIVVVIVAILVGIVALSLGGLTDTASDTARATELAIVQAAIDTYNAQNVAVKQEPAIAAQASAAKISVSGTAFGQYLPRETNYCYTWGDGGDALVQGDCPPPK